MFVTEQIQIAFSDKNCDLQETFKKYSLFYEIILRNFILHQMKISLVTFATYVLLNEENYLTPQKVFVGIALFDTLNLPLATLPMLAVDIAEVNCCCMNNTFFFGNHQIFLNTIVHGLGILQFSALSQTQKTEN